MNIRTSLLVGLLGCCSAFAMADTAFISIKTSGQGQIMGSCAKKGHEGWIEVSSVKSPRDLASGQASGKVNVQDISMMKSSLMFEHEIISPRDPASGLPTGKRMHKPFVITCELDRAGQQMMQALMNNEQITEMRCCIVADDGTMRTCVLSGASLEEVAFSKSSGGQRPMESLSFNFTKIEWDLKTAKAASLDL